MEVECRHLSRSPQSRAHILNSRPLIGSLDPVRVSIYVIFDVHLMGIRLSCVAVTSDFSIRIEDVFVQTPVHRHF